ncbi:family 43 glycosylhydrolase [Streptococcus sp. S784/96/1]|uniref:family 43 glycosylhydrolase n=1 Tax=Streptococcus sp. S784/96/1 TaxID=2653499 RepID=UPI00138733B2|nr:family 43 glycosylhydrolase [Streptococcus sp. S784/96/1]
MTYTSIKPGETWLDTSGKPIEAHAGGIFYENGTYYWYGENKAETDGISPVWTTGIKIYQSKDLYNWEDLGYLIPPVRDDENSSLHPHKRVDRPHILKNEKTGKYVCWIKLSGDEGCFTIWQADSLLGNYECVENVYYPDGHKIGDFDLIEESGKAYLFTDIEHSGIYCYELTEDYLATAKEINRHYTGLHAPFVREAPALLKKDGCYWMLTSGMTGYLPNKSDRAVSASVTDQFESKGNPHIDDVSNASFNSQISYIFKVPNRDLYIALADRWVPDFIIDAHKADVIERAIARHFDPENYQVTQEELAILMNSPMLKTADTSKARYVWLPITFENNQPVIRWYDEWRIEDFD